jgi:lambda family phage portal protein
MSRFLKALAWVAPQAAVSRARALALLEHVRAYDGAMGGRRAQSFTAKGSSANAELAGALPKLRDRVRDLVRNTPFAARTLDIVGGHAIGTGIRVEWNTGADRTDRLTGEAFEEWCRTSDVEGVLDFAGQQLVATRSMLEGGDAVVRLVDRPMGRGRRVPLALQVLEGDFIDEARDGATYDGRQARLGVAVGDWSERLGLYLHRDHPGEPLRRYAGVAGSAFVPREEALHLYRPLRAGQVRGVPFLAPVVMTSRDFADFMDAIVVKARLEACLGLFVKADNSGPKTLAQGKAENGRTVEEMRPGMILYGQPGEEVTTIAPTSAPQVEPVSKVALRGMAVGAGVTYAQMTGDLTEANYSSLKAGSIDFRRLVEQLQWLVLVPMLMERVVERWVDRAILAGVLRERRGGYPRSYIMPAVEPIDPLKDLKADILAVRSGRMAPQEFIAAYGRPWREVIAQFDAFYDAIGDKVFDIDPRRTTQAGQAQQDPAEINPEDKPDA